MHHKIVIVQQEQNERIRAVVRTHIYTGMHMSMHIYTEKCGDGAVFLSVYAYFCVLASRWF